MHKKGYTMIELVMVILIIGIISAVFVTRIMESQYLNYGIVLATIRDHIRYAADYAMANGVKTEVDFDVNNNRYLIYQETDLGKSLIKNPENGEDFIINLGTGKYKGVELTDADINGTSEIKFMPYGTPFDGNGQKLQTQAFIEVNGQKEITIYPVSGLCKLLD